MIDIQSIVPTKPCQIISKADDYAIYKLADLRFELSKSIDNSASMEVYYILSSEELEQFQTIGISTLENRLRDMNDNHDEYPVVSLR